MPPCPITQVPTRTGPSYRIAVAEKFLTSRPPCTYDLHERPYSYRKYRQRRDVGKVTDDLFGLVSFSVSDYVTKLYGMWIYARISADIPVYQSPNDLKWGYLNSAQK